MPSYHLTLLFLIPFSLGSAPQCTEPNTCYGMPVNCRPGTDCHLILNFDAQGNLDLYVNDIVDPMGYVAVAVDGMSDGGETEYVICIPHQEQRLRGIAKGEEPIRIIEQPMAKYVRRLSQSSFTCSFLTTELPANFQHRDVFSVVEGVYEENLVIPQGAQLSEPLYLHPVAFRSSDSVDSDGVLSPDERKAASDFLGKLRRINDGEESELEVPEGDSEDEEDGLEDLLEKKKYSTRKRDEEKKKASRRRQEEEEDDAPRKKSKSRPSRYQEEDEEEEEEEEEEKPKKKSNKKSRRDEEEEEEEGEEEEEEEEERPRKKGKKGGKRGRKEKKEEEDEEDEGEYQEEDMGSDEDEDNGSNQLAPPVIIASVLFVLMIAQ